MKNSLNATVEVYQVYTLYTIKINTKIPLWSSNLDVHEMTLYQAAGWGLKLSETWPTQ
jgi:hypothetical protein